MVKVFLITKIRTSNVGNQALSSELIALFCKIVGIDNLRVEGRPQGLDGYQLSRLSGLREPVKMFEEWTDMLVQLFLAQKGSSNGFTPAIRSVELTDFHSTAWNLEKVKSWLRPIKRQLSKWIALREVYRRRLTLIADSDWVIYSGAGEVGDNNVFLRQLVELRVAQKLGKSTAVVNQSIVVKSPLVRSLVEKVYGNLQYAVVRGAKSRDLLLSVGLAPEKIQIVPDTALLTKSLEREATVVPGRPRVGINFTPRVGLSDSAGKKIVDLLKSLGYELVFITNEPFEDSQVAARMRTMYNVQSAPVLNYRSYAYFLKQLNFVISTRLHTNILALTAGTPTIPIEGNQFKTGELLELLEYPVKVINPSDPNWSDTLEQEVLNLHQNRYDFDQYFGETLPKHVANVAQNALWLNRFAGKNN